MSEEIKHLYEGMYIINATLTSEARTKVMEKIQSMITDHGGEIHKEHEMGRRRLSYEMDRQKEGYYHVLYFSVVPPAIEKMWKEYHLMEDLIRFMTLRTSEVPEKLEFRPLEHPAEN